MNTDDAAPDAAPPVIATPDYEPEPTVPVYEPPTTPQSPFIHGTKKHRSSYRSSYRPKSPTRTIINLGEARAKMERKLEREMEYLFNEQTEQLKKNRIIDGFGIFCILPPSPKKQSHREELQEARNKILSLSPGLTFKNALRRCKGTQYMGIYMTLLRSRTDSIRERYSHVDFDDIKYDYDYIYNHFNDINQYIYDNIVLIE